MSAELGIHQHGNTR